MKYNHEIVKGDFCVKVDRIGTVFSLTVLSEITTDKPIKADLKIGFPDGREPLSMIVEAILIEGKPSQRSPTFRGHEIPNRIFIAIPEEIGMDPNDLHQAQFEIISISEIEGSSDFDNFGVYY